MFGNLLGSVWEKAQWERARETFISQRYFWQREFTIPAEFKYVGKNALKGCRTLERLIIPGTVKEVENGAFENCVNLREVILEEGIKSLGADLFSGCKKLYRITTPDSLNFVSMRSFRKIPNLREPVLNKSGTDFIYYPAYLGETVVTVPDGVRIIRQDAFKDCETVEKVILPNTLEVIEIEAFNGVGLKSITLPESLKLVKSYAFSSCRKLESVDIHCDYSAIRFNAFKYCYHLQIPMDSPSRYIEFMRMCGKQLFKVPKKLDLPSDGYEHDQRFLECAAGCMMGNRGAMEQMADFFLSKQQQTGHLFYLLAERFWRVRLYLLVDEKAKQWLFDWVTKHPNEQMEIAASASLSGGEGNVLNALGFLFFDSDRSYDIQQPDESGVVEVTAFDDEDGPDEDGFGSETYYDWWYMTENLAMAPNVGYIHSYSSRDKHNNEKKFEELHNYVADIWNNHPEFVELEIQKAIRKRRKCFLK